MPGNIDSAVSRSKPFFLNSLRSELVLPLILALSYVLMVSLQLKAHLYFDELFTFYIAGAASFKQMLFETQTIDLHPPLVYTVVRFWQALFGTSEIVARLPIAIAFFLASFGFYRFLKPRLGNLWSAVAVLLFWSTPAFIYATELRPYAFVLLFFSLAICGWDGVHGQHRILHLTLLTLGGIGLALSHVCGIFALAAIGTPELIAQVRAKRFDFVVWCTFVPAIALVVYGYFNLVHNLDVVLWPTVFQAGPRRLAIYFYRELKGIWLQLALLLAVAAFLTPLRLHGLLGRLRKMGAEDSCLTISLLCIPVVLNALLMVGHKAFFERYAIESSLTISVLSIATAAALSSFSRKAGACALVILVSFGIWNNLVKRAWLDFRITTEPDVDQFRPDLPFVVSNGLVFLELDHYEKSTFLSRVTYLTDRASASRLSHTTVFEVMPQLQLYFPIRAHISSYASFVAGTRHFLMLSNPVWPEEWLPKKLIEDGAIIKPISKSLEKYKLLSTVYEVRLGEKLP